MPLKIDPAFLDVGHAVDVGHVDTGDEEGTFELGMNEWAEDRRRRRPCDDEVEERSREPDGSVVKRGDRAGAEALLEPTLDVRRECARVGGGGLLSRADEERKRVAVNSKWRRARRADVAESAGNHV